MSAPLEIVIAEDNPRDRAFLCGALSAYTTVCADDGRAALAVLKGRSAPYLISDIQMPSVNGIALAKQLWGEAPASRILFWTQHRDETYVRAVAKLIPADTVYGYVLKENSADVLRRAVAAVFIDQQCWIDPQVRPVQARSQNRVSGLSDAEYAVLVDIALGLTDASIAQRHYLSRRGAQNRLRSLYSKLGIDSADGDELFNLRARAIGIALRRGLLNADELTHAERQLRLWLEHP